MRPDAAPIQPRRQFNPDERDTNDEGERHENEDDETGREPDSRPAPTKEDASAGNGQNGQQHRHASVGDRMEPGRRGERCDIERQPSHQKTKEWLRDSRGGAAAVIHFGSI